MKCVVLSTLPDETSDFFRRRLRGERNEALAFRRDGTIEDRDDEDATPPAAGRNIFQPDEGCYQVPAAQKADIVLIETDSGGREVRSKGKARRGLVDVNLATGRAVGRVFDVGESYEYMPTAGTGQGGS
jgi:hypothetical protein